MSKNPVFVNRKVLPNGNGFIFGVPSSGKSMTAEREEVSILLADLNADIILIDPEREYTPLS